MLIRKWAKQLNEKHSIFMERYNKLVSDGVKFPSEDAELITYNIYFEASDNNQKNEKNEKNDNNNNDNVDFFSNEMDKYLYGNLEFPEEEFGNQFSNIRTSEIGDYFKYLNNSRKNTLERKKRPSKVNDNNIINKDNIAQNNIIENKNNNENNDNNDNISKEEKNIEPAKPEDEIININEVKEGDELNNIENLKIEEKNETPPKVSEVESSSFKNYRSDPTIFKKKWVDKINELNNWISEGKKCKYFDNLREGVREFLIGLNEIEDIILNCAKIGDDTGRDIVSNIKSDMQQTCYRFECLVKSKKVEKFKSAFNGNAKKYAYNPEILFDDPADYLKLMNKERTGIRKFGHNVKEGLFKVGRSFKSKKSNKEKDKEKEKEKKGDNKKNERELESLDPNSQEDQK